MDLEKYPGIFIPCEDEQALKELVKMLYENEILTDEGFKLVNVPEGFSLNSE